MGMVDADVSVSSHLKGELVWVADKQLQVTKKAVIPYSGKVWRGETLANSEHLAEKSLANE